MTTAPIARYSTPAIALHWATALLIIANLTVGYWMEAQPRGPGKMEIFQLHMSLGVSILVLTVARIGWRLLNPPPPLPPSVPASLRLLAGGTHIGFYLLLLALPLSGWLIASASPLNLPKDWFGLFPWPDLPVGTSRPLARAAAGTHGLLVYGLYVLLALHLAGAVRHALNRDGLLTRMIPATKIAATRR